MHTLPVSLAVITYNEAEAIARCLDSVSFAQEKIVVDSGSNDGTVEIAKKHGAKVIHQDWLGFGAQRNFASDQCSNDWILALDADEWLSDELVKELTEKLPDIIESNICAGILHMRANFMGKPLRFYSPSANAKKTRLYNRKRAKWNDVSVHESLQYEGGDTIFSAHFNHANNPTLVHKQLKILRYAELKCCDWNKRNKKLHMWKTPFVFALSFLKDYILRLAILDGWRGFITAQTTANYAVYKRMRYYEMLENPGSVKQAKNHLIYHNIER